jgi:hypothetical protein
MQDVGTREPSDDAMALLRLRCDGCSYGVSVRKTPERCPMCDGSAWIVEGGRPSTDLTAADSALTRDKDPRAFPGMPRT